MTQLVVSQDELLATELAEEAEAKFGKDSEIVHIDADAGLDGIEEALFAGSLFSDRRLVILRNAQTLLKAGVERLATALRAEGDPADLIILAVTERPPTTLLNGLKGLADVTRLNRPRRGELVAWVVKRMKKGGLVPSGDAAAALVDSVGENLRDLDQAIGQLALRGGTGTKVNAEDVGEHFARSAEQPAWILFDAIVKHEGGKAFEALRRLLDSGDEPLPLLGALVSQVRGLMRVKSILEREPGTSDNDIAKMTGMTPGRAGVMKRQCARLSWDWLTGMHRMLAQADFELKGGEDGAVLPGQIVMERVVAGALDTR